MLGEITKDENKTLPDLSVREVATLVPIILFCFWIGLYPSPYLKAMEASVANVIQIVEKGASGKAVGAKPAAALPSPAAPPSAPAEAKASEGQAPGATATVPTAPPAPPTMSGTQPPASTPAARAAQPVAPNPGTSR
jgi:hypothetical protein